MAGGFTNLAGLPRHRRPACPGPARGQAATPAPARGAMPAQVRRCFALTEAAPRLARHFVRDAVTAWGDDDLLVDAEILVAELSANAFRHAGTDFAVTVTWSPSALRISVRDSGPAPGPAAVPPRAGSGHGLDVVSKLASDWGMVTLTNGKAYWAELRR